jgi:AcrR family transcriptional regulator
MGRTKSPQDESETQQLLLQAALDVIAEKGIESATARGIADKAGVNQALVFYYFGSVTKLIIASVTDMSTKRYAVYEKELAGCSNMQELVEAFIRVFEEDRKNCSFLVLSQFVSGAQGNDEVAKEVEPIFTSWINLTKSSLQRVLGDVSLPQGVTLDDIALVLMSSLLGVQFLATIPEYEDRVTGLVEKGKNASALFALLPMLIGNLPKN